MQRTHEQEETITESILEWRKFWIRVLMTAVGLQGTSRKMLM